MPVHSKRGFLSVSSLLAVGVLAAVQPATAAEVVNEEATVDVQTQSVDIKPPAPAVGERDNDDDDDDEDEDDDEIDEEEEELEKLAQHDRLLDLADELDAAALRKKREEKADKIAEQAAARIKAEEIVDSKRPEPFNPADPNVRYYGGAYYKCNSMGFNCLCEDGCRVFYVPRQQPPAEWAAYHERRRRDWYRRRGRPVPGDEADTGDKQKGEAQAEAQTAQEPVKASKPKVAKPAKTQPPKKSHPEPAAPADEPASSAGTAAAGSIPVVPAPGQSR